MSNESLEPKADARTTARRRLVRGVFAAPAALTLYSGGAIAAASNQRCIASQANDPQLPGPAGQADTWVRVDEYVKDGTLLVKTSDLVAIRGSAGMATALFTSAWWTVANPSVAFAPSSPPPTKTGRYVAVRIDTDGSIIGIVSGVSNGAPAEGGTAIAQSCWSSFSGVRF